MPLKAVVDNLEGVDEALHGLYVEDGGKFYLSVEGIDEHTAVRGLKSNKDTLLAEKKRLEKALEQYEGLDAEAAREALRKMEETEEAGLKDKGKFEELKSKLTEKHTTELQKKDGEITKLTSFIERLLVDDAINRAMEEIDVLPHFRPAVRALMKERGPKVLRDGDDFRGVMPTDMGEAEIGSYMKEWARTDDAAHYVKAEVPSGSGGQGGRGEGGRMTNPFKAESRNLTEQMRLAKEDPALAKRLAAAAGVTLNV